MKARVEQTSSADLISRMQEVSLEPSEREIYNRCLQSSVGLWAGFVDGEFVSITGLIPPTLLSNEAHLWLHTTPALKGHEFVFIRHSQRFIEEALKRYPTIVGITMADNEKAVRWLKWLGAVFQETSEGVLSFTIKAK